MSSRLIDMPTSACFIYHAAPPPIYSQTGVWFQSAHGAGDGWSLNVNDVHTPSDVAGRKIKRTHVDIYMSIYNQAVFVNSITAMVCLFVSRV